MERRRQSFVGVRTRRSDRTGESWGEQCCLQLAGDGARRSHSLSPEVTIVTRDEAIKNLGEREATKLVGVHQNFEGDINGRALLDFPRDQEH